MEDVEKERTDRMEYKYTESMVSLLSAAEEFLAGSAEKKNTGGIPEVSVGDVLDKLTVPNENPVVISAEVRCPYAKNKDAKVKVMASALSGDERNGGLGLRETDIKLVPNTFGVCKLFMGPCLPAILGSRWNGCDGGNLIGGQPSVNMSSYMICSIGGLITLKTNGQRAGSTKKEYVTLEMLQNAPSLNAWAYKPVDTYDVKTSLPEYGEIRKYTQEDVDEINRVLEKYEINTPERIAQFLAQCAVESEAGRLPLEQYDGDDIFAYFKKYEVGQRAIDLGNTEEGDGAKYRGGGAIQITGRAAYTAFSEYMDDPKILEDGALYVGQEYFGESAGYYWSVFKPESANDDRFNLNKKCDENAGVYEITGIINSGYEGYPEREKYYDYYIGQLNESWENDD